MFPDLRNNIRSGNSSLYECSISYSTLKHSFVSRFLITTSASTRVLLERNLESLKAFFYKYLYKLYFTPFNSGFQGQNEGDLAYFCSLLYIKKIIYKTCIKSQGLSL
jgi:hypothetical protein